jgi:hypothetical protein
MAGLSGASWGYIHGGRPAGGDSGKVERMVCTDRIGRARRSAAGVLVLAVLVGSCGVAAFVVATFGVAWSGTLALFIAVPLSGMVALRAWWSAFSRPLSAQADDRVLVAVGGGYDERRARNTAS